MRHWFLYAALALAWASPAGADPACKAMVLKVSGPATVHPFPKTNNRVVTGQMWSVGDVVDVPAGSTVTLLLLSQGKRVEVTGKGTLRVTPAGLVLGNCTSHPLNTAQHQLALSGENHRQIGGATVRGTPKLLDAKLDRITVTSTGLVVSCPAESGAPPSLRFAFLDYYCMPNLNKELAVLEEAGRGESLGCLINKDGALLVKGQRNDSRWEWEAPWPAGTPSKSLGLNISPELGGDDWLYTRVRMPTAEDERQCVTAKTDALQWAEKEPKSAQPWLVYAALLEEKGRLEEANSMVSKALLAQPKDEGLIQMKARLLMDLGRYHQASDLLKANPPKKPQ